MAPGALATLGWFAALAWLATPAYAATYPPRPARAAEVIRAILDRGPHAGECERCHTMHAEGATPEAFALVGPDDNSLCADCHTTPWSGQSYPDTWTYTRSAHGQDPNVVWPGPEPFPRTEPDAAGKCVNCHDPHGWTDTTGDIPFLAHAREETLCLRCHDGAPAVANVALDFTKPFAHPTSSLTGLHTGANESSPGDFGSAPVNRRHAECGDCHNPHVAYADAGAPPPAPDLSRRNLGVSRIRAQQGGPGVAPTYLFTAGSDTLSAPLAEYQLCYKCHSSWTVQPPGQTDLALVLNPANPSYHPVEAVGRDASILLAAFTPGWSPFSLTRCGDCHGSDFGTSEGPHGSNYRYILKKPYTASSQRRMMGSDELCFECHVWDVYADRSAPGAVQAASRFNKPSAEQGHAFHVGSKEYPCYACHATHGSTTLRHSIATGRNPGLISYTETATGGTCTPTCHRPTSYTVNYAR